MSTKRHEPRHHRTVCLTPEIFDSIGAIEPGAGSKIQLTDALKHLLREPADLCLPFRGHAARRGDKLGFLKATVEFALHRHDLGEEFRDYLKSLQL